MHCRVAEIKVDRTMYGDRTHLLIWSRWKLAAGGIHGVGVFYVLLFVVVGRLWYFYRAIFFLSIIVERYLRSRDTR